MKRFNRSAIIALVAGLVAGSLALAPAHALDYEELMKLKKQFEVVRDLVRKFRGMQPAPQQPQPPQPAQTPPAPTAPADGTSAPAQPATPAMTGGISFKGNCTGRDESGYAENAQINIADGKVTALAVRIDIPKRGACRYQLSQFKQTKSSPFVELIAHSNSYCAVRVWQQVSRVTLAATDCSDKCVPGAFDYAWPVEFETTGGCH